MFARTPIAATCLLVTYLTTTTEATELNTALDRAAKYLWSQQHEDGSWRSDYYGVMKSGQSLTPIALYALMLEGKEFTDEVEQHRARAVSFILTGIDDEGAIGRSDPDILEYPVYSTSYAAEALRRYNNSLGPFTAYGNTDLPERVELLWNFLMLAQYQAANGFTPENVAYGGWGFNAPEGKGIVGHMDLAHTRKALAALQYYDDHEKLRDIRRRAENFLLLMQKDPRASAEHPHPIELDGIHTTPGYDGGFFFSPIALSANKAPYDENNHCWPSYATATCDGILALLACGFAQDDPRVVAAADWLRKHNDVDYPQGIPTDHAEPWGDAVRFYHYSVRAEVYQKLNFSQEDKARLASAILRHQRPDGSFVNTASPLMKEDDPIVCTALAIIALAHCQ